jgi:hypothetical protein
MRRRFACTLKQLCFVLSALALVAGCWEEIRYTPPEKSAPPAAAADTPQPTNGDAKSAESPNGAVDQTAP